MNSVEQIKTALTRIEHPDSDETITLREFALLIGAVHTIGLCDLPDAGVDPLAVQHLLAALADLKHAMANANLAELHQTRALAARY